MAIKSYATTLFWLLHGSSVDNGSTWGRVHKFESQCQRKKKVKSWFCWSRSSIGFEHLRKTSINWLFLLQLGVREIISGPPSPNRLASFQKVRRLLASTTAELAPVASHHPAALAGVEREHPFPRPVLFAARSSPAQQFVHFPAWTNIFLATWFQYLFSRVTGRFLDLLPGTREPEGHRETCLLNIDPIDGPGAAGREGGRKIWCLLWYASLTSSYLSTTSCLWKHFRNTISQWRGRSYCLSHHAWPIWTF